MSRALRVAEKDREGACIPQNQNYQLIYGGTGIRFINVLAEDKCQEFFWNGTSKQIKFNNGAEILDLTSSDIEITNLKFEISGDSLGDNLQPMVKINLEARVKSGKGKINLQTCISQRNLDVY